MSTVVLLTARLADRDATGNDVLEMYRVLAQAGVHTVLCAEVNETDYPVLSLRRARPLLSNPDNLLIYHHSVGFPNGVNHVLAARCRKVVRYHNITPAHFFDCYHPELAVLCRAGRAELPRLIAGNIDLFLSDSDYNAAELLRLGLAPERSAVVPPFHVISRLLAGDDDPPARARYSDGKVNLLAVGRISPNKGHAQLLQAFTAYQRFYQPDSRLIVVGADDPSMKDYSRLVRHLVAELELDSSVDFVGSVSESTLRTLYGLADALVTTSEHEGFCVPVVEGLALGTPNVACGDSAVPGTLGAAGIVWDQFDPLLMAESIHTVTTQPHVSDLLRRLGRQRYEAQFAPDRIAASFLYALRPLLPGKARAANTAPKSSKTATNNSDLALSTALTQLAEIQDDIRNRASRKRDQLVQSAPSDRLVQLVCRQSAAPLLFQTEQHLHTALHNCAAPGEPPGYRRFPWPVRMALKGITRLMVLFSRFITRKQSIQNANLSQAVLHLLEAQRHSQQRIQDFERRLQIMEERRLAG